VSTSLIQLLVSQGYGQSRGCVRTALTQANTAAGERSVVLQPEGVAGGAGVGVGAGAGVRAGAGAGAGCAGAGGVVVVVCAGAGAAGAYEVVGQLGNLFTGRPPASCC
jgi:hypothetical protein